MAWPGAAQDLDGVLLIWQLCHSPCKAYGTQLAALDGSHEVVRCLGTCKAVAKSFCKDCP